MNKFCINHPGATDHDTASCPWTTNDAIRRIVESLPAAPEQEAVVFVAADALSDAEQVGMHATRKPNALQCVPLYTHADDGEVERLRVELVEARRNEHNSEVAYRAAIERQEELRDELKTERLRADAAADDANEAEQKLSEALAARDKWGSNFQKAISAGADIEQKLSEAKLLLRDAETVIGQFMPNAAKCFGLDFQLINDTLRKIAFLSATAQPAECDICKGTGTVATTETDHEGNTLETWCPKGCKDGFDAQYGKPADGVKP